MLLFAIPRKISTIASKPFLSSKIYKYYRRLAFYFFSFSLSAVINFLLDLVEQINRFDRSQVINISRTELV